MMWLSANESEALNLSLSVATRSVLLSLPLALLLAWVLTRRQFLGRTMLDAFVHLPLVLPPVVVGYFLLLLFGARGPIGGWLERVFGIELIFTRNGAALATAVMSFPADGARHAHFAGKRRSRTGGCRAHSWAPAPSTALPASPCR